jgi:hypothetical protein
MMLRCVRPVPPPLHIYMHLLLLKTNAVQKRINKKGPKYTIFDAARDVDVAFIQDLIILAEKTIVSNGVGGHLYWFPTKNEPNHAKIFKQTDKVNLKDAIFYAVRHGHLDVVRLCLSGGARMSFQNG